MILKDISFPSPQDNILYDEVLLRLADTGAGGEVLRFWESPVPFVVLGRIGKLDEDVDAEQAAADHVPVLRRGSGGGTVLQGPGCLNFALVLSKELRPPLHDLHRSYRVILDKIVETLKKMGVDAAFFPTSDLALRQSRKKFSGNAQHRGRNFILHHGTVLYAFDLGLIPKYLKMPKAVPEYRVNRPHRDFVCNLPITPEDFKKRFALAWQADRPEDVSEGELEMLAEFRSSRDPLLDLSGR